jgi:hypothetical protein
MVGGDETVTALYDIDFRAGAGQLTITDAQSSSSPNQHGTGSGVIDIFPDPGGGGSCVQGPGVSAFIVNGALIAVI